MKFCKMHGLGNDFIVLDCVENAPPENPGELAKSLCRAHFSVGADGLVFVLPSDIADARMRIFNADGTEPEMCGNAIRCVGKLLYEKGYVNSARFSVETLAGIMALEVFESGGVVSKVSVDMGKPTHIGAANVIIEGEKVDFMRVSTGNPHAVTFAAYPDDEVFLEYGLKISRNPIFPEGTNVEFCRADSRAHITVRVFERGVGPTLACGTGATAAFFAGVTTGITDRRCAVKLPGGELEFEMNGAGHVIMTGAAEISFTGETA